MSKIEVSGYKGPGTQPKLPSGYLLGIGNPLLDLVVDVDQTFLDKYVAKENQTLPTLADENQKAMYKDIVDTYGDNVKYLAGGATQNSIRVAQWLLNSEDATRFIGCVGNDQFGEKLAKSCEEGGVKPFYNKSDKANTGLCAVLVNKKERTLVTDLAAADLYDHAHTLLDETNEIIKTAQIYYMSSFFLTPETNIQTAELIAKHAAEESKIFAINLSAPFIMQVPPFFERVKKVIPLVDYVFGNETEAAALIESMGWKCDLLEGALKLSSLPKENGARGRIVVFTQGKDDTIVALNGKLTSYPVPPLDDELLVDTNGAGDAFVGGFLARLCQGFNIDECVRSAHYAARVVIQQSGCAVPAQPDI